MTKAEKKLIIFNLFSDIQQTTSFEILEKKLTKLIEEIYSSGFDLQGLKVVSNIIQTFIADIPNKVIDNDNTHFRVESSKTAILTLIDMSKLLA